MTHVEDIHRIRAVLTDASGKGEGMNEGLTRTYGLNSSLLVRTRPSQDPTGIATLATETGQDFDSDSIPRSLECDNGSSEK